MAEFAVFCRVRRALTYWLYTVAELIVSAIDKLSQNDNWRTRCTRAASYFTDHGSHFSFQSERERVDPQRGVE